MTEEERFDRDCVRGFVGEIVLMNMVRNEGYFVLHAGARGARVHDGNRRSLPSPDLLVCGPTGGSVWIDVKVRGDRFSMQRLLKGDCRRSAPAYAKVAAGMGAASAAMVYLLMREECLVWVQVWPTVKVASMPVLDLNHGIRRMEREVIRMRDES